MSESLRDQLLGLGLVDKSKLQQAKKDQRQRVRIPQANRDAVSKVVTQAAAEKVVRDRELNRQKEQKQAAKARKVLLKQFLDQNQLNDPKADQPYNFTHGINIKRLYVTKSQQEKLIAGKLAIVHSGDRYVLVEIAAATKIKDISPDTFVFIAPTQATNEDDEYAGFQIPDDLMW
ncbi:hypothetical protein TI04_01390 [Achromatium sp. WMS2]|nr:hypothetical protein TI04_01390 [Achromatium sp. WMS2]